MSVFLRSNEIKYFLQVATLLGCSNMLKKTIIICGPTENVVPWSKKDEVNALSQKVNVLQVTLYLCAPGQLIYTLPWGVSHGTFHQCILQGMIYIKHLIIFFLFDCKFCIFTSLQVRNNW